MLLSTEHNGSNAVHVDSCRKAPRKKNTHTNGLTHRMCWSETFRPTDPKGVNECEWKTSRLVKYPPHFNLLDSRRFFPYVPHNNLFVANIFSHIVACVCVRARMLFHVLNLNATTFVAAGTRKNGTFLLNFMQKEGKKREQHSNLICGFNFSFDTMRNDTKLTKHLSQKCRAVLFVCIGDDILMNQILVNRISNFEYQIFMSSYIEWKASARTIFKYCALRPGITFIFYTLIWNFHSYFMDLLSFFSLLRYSTANQKFSYIIRCYSLDLTLNTFTAS